MADHQRPELALSAECFDDFFQGWKDPILQFIHAEDIVPLLKRGIRELLSSILQLSDGLIDCRNRLQQSMPLDLRDRLI